MHLSGQHESRNPYADDRHFRHGPAPRSQHPVAQADYSITRKYGGTGLGLTICKKLVTMMEGEIWAEDDPLNRYLLSTILQDMGCNPVAVDNGPEALRRLENDTFDLVLMDISMPEMDGITATRHIRQYSEKSLNRHVPILAVTAHVLDESREKFIGAGFSDVVTKPFSIPGLQKVIDKFNPRRETSQTGSPTDPP
jgi:CheY-like chemotaxis protein